MSPKLNLPGEYLVLPEGTFEELWAAARRDLGPVDLHTLSDGSELAQILIFRDGKLQGTSCGRARTPRGALQIAIARAAKPNPDLYAREPGTPRDAIFEYFAGGPADI